MDLVSFISFFCMVVSGCVAHVDIMDKMLFLTAAKIFIAQGLVGIYNIVFEEGQYSSLLYGIHYLEFISVIHLIAVEVAVAEGVSWQLAFIILIPPAIDILTKILVDGSLPITSITNYVFLFFTAFFAYFTQDINLATLCILYLLPLIYVDKTWETRFVKSVALYFGTLYFISRTEKYPPYLNFLSSYVTPN